MLIFDALLFGWSLGCIIYDVRHHGHSDHNLSGIDIPLSEFKIGSPELSDTHKSIIQSMGSGKLNEWIEKQKS